MKTAGIATWVLMAVVGTGVAGAQVQPPQDRIDTALARARQVGIPEALLTSKVAEGRAKGVSLERIAAAVERREAALERASQALSGREDVGAADLAVAADAVEAGVSDAVLETVAASAPLERRAVAIAALTELVELGHVPEDALARVQEALARGPEALLNLPAEAGRGAGGPGLPSPAAGRGGSRGGPPASVPAPGGAAQPRRPDMPTNVPPAGRGGPGGGI